MWLCDIDGTLALRNDRDPFDWSRVSEDSPNSPVLLVVRALIMDYQDLGFISGRMEQCREDTRDWLSDNIDVPHFRLDEHLSRLWMRADGDNRPDDIVKKEIYETQIMPHYTVTGILDDRDKVVRMWRSLGLTCIQVAEGNF